ncbi:integrase catalytic domain-containing protein [Nephila pilipes]|uniref:Integrase catalytic domain-containing protein n=1 Tax=Nephila pilipes TaxID=299642 RepID=A0A8X6PT42_NEPPI|nr:integrase catalytic domain-containing protein [Nephila pilipes]
MHGNLYFERRTSSLLTESSKYIERRPLYLAHSDNTVNLIFNHVPKVRPLAIKQGSEGDGTKTDVDKHVSLRGYLDGEAKRLVDGISIIGDTYEKTKKLLEEKYGNKDRIIQPYLEYLEHLKAVRDPSAMELNDIYIECNRRLQALNALDENTEAYERILAPKIIRAFPIEIYCRCIIYAMREKLAEGNITRFMQFLAEKVKRSVEAQNIRTFESNNSYTTHPAATLEISQFAHKKKLKLADPPDNSSLPIELLIDGHYYWQIVTAESPIKLSQSFVMVSSMFGGILSGLRTHTTITDNASVHQVSV